MMLRMRRSAKRAADVVLGTLAVGLLNSLKHANPDRTADFAGWLMRTIGPWFPENRIGRDNLTAAFPEKSAAEIDAILRGVWDNLGRLGAEFAQLDQLWDFDHTQTNSNTRIEQVVGGVERFVQLMNDGKPALIFSAHLANWELPAISAATYKLDSAILYRKPNNEIIDRWLRKTRTANMGEMIPTGLSAPVKLAEALTRGAHVGMLVDQYYVRGVEVIFFGRPTRANPMLARLAQHFNCPIHGARMIRLPGHRFRGELTEEIAPVRDAAGNVDIAGTMQVITSVVEGWIREHPEQWLWLHRRWRPEDN